VAGPGVAGAAGDGEADVVLVPSRTAGDGDEEGTPTVIAEAGAARLPVVSTRHAGIPEQIDDGVTGVLAAERDVAGLADALATLAASAATRAAMGEAARAKVAREYSLAAHRASLKPSMPPRWMSPLSTSPPRDLEEIRRDGVTSVNRG
jgi:glycosyltransferase involved in cell wall biosynthesis